MANINKIRISGSTYNIEDSSATKTVKLTQAQYNQLSPKDPNTFYIITDAEYFDPSGYVTSAQTESAITQAVSGKQDTLVSSVNIKTINNESLLGSGNITIQGGGGSTYTAGDGIDITNDVISVTGKADTSAVTSVSDSLTAHTANTTVHVTAQDKTNWNAKSNFSGSYNDLTDKPTIPTSASQLTNDAGYATSGYVDSAVSGKVDTSTFNTYSGSVETALSGKQDTLSAGTNITIVDNVISAEGGGGKAVSGGTNISITTGETADTINCTLPISVGTNTSSIKLGGGGNVEGKNSFIIGQGGIVYSDYSLGVGYNNYNTANYTFACGFGIQTTNPNQSSFGIFNKNNSNVLFSVGNGTNIARHNAFEIRQNGDIYLNNGTSDVKLQEYLQIKAVQITQSAYDALATKDPNTLYCIIN